MTIKVLDNTFLSALMKELRGINILGRAAKVYHFLTSPFVYKETQKGFPANTVKHLYRYIEVKDIELDSELLEYLRARYPRVHEGEISAFLLVFKLREKSYFVTDDKEMRKTIDKLNEDGIFKRQLERIGLPWKQVRYTGTVGLIKRLCEKDIIKRKEIPVIVQNLKNGSFRIDMKYLRWLERGCNEG